MKKVLAVAGIGAALIAGALTPAAQAIGPGPDGYGGSTTVRAVISWNGPNCINAWVGGRYGGTIPITLCGGSATYTERGPFSSGRWIGVDPEMSGAAAVACDLFVDGARVASGNANRGDGTEATCLVQV